MSDWLLSIVWYGSLLAIALGVLQLLRPLLRRQMILQRSAAIAIAAALLAIGIMIWLAPAAQSVPQTMTALDRALPTYQFREMHVRSIDAPVDRVRRAIRDVTAGDIALFQLFTRLRRLGRTGPESILNAPDDAPILDVATRSGFILLMDSEQEVALGSVVAAPRALLPGIRKADAAWFESLAAPGVVKAGMNFVIQAEGPGRTRLMTETRVFATDRAAARRFTAYWRTIFPGSWILRVTWLDAIARRAEAAP